MSFKVEIDSDKFDEATLRITLVKSMLSLIYSRLDASASGTFLEVTDTIHVAQMMLEDSYGLLNQIEATA